jgi:hypothetical protein
MQMFLVSGIKMITTSLLSSRQTGLRICITSNFNADPGTDPSFKRRTSHFKTDPNPAFHPIADPIRILLLSLLRDFLFQTGPDPAFHYIADPAFQKILICLDPDQQS